MLKPSAWQIIALIVVLILLFGWKSLPNMARSLGQSMRIFKSEVDQMKEPSAASRDTVPGEAADQHRDDRHRDERDRDDRDRDYRDRDGYVGDHDRTEQLDERDRGGLRDRADDLKDRARDTADDVRDRGAHVRDEFRDGLRGDDGRSDDPRA